MLVVLLHVLLQIITFSNCPENKKYITSDLLFSKIYSTGSMTYIFKKELSTTGITVYAIYFVYRYFRDFGLDGEIREGLIFKYSMFSLL